MRALLLERLEPRLALSVLRVDQDASGANDGTSWTNAYTDLQDGPGRGASTPTTRPQH